MRKMIGCKTLWSVFIGTLLIIAFSDCRPAIDDDFSIDDKGLYDVPYDGSGAPTDTGIGVSPPISSIRLLGSGEEIGSADTGSFGDDDEVMEEDGSGSASGDDDVSMESTTTGSSPKASSLPSTSSRLTSNWTTESQKGSNLTIDFDYGSGHPVELDTETTTVLSYFELGSEEGSGVTEPPTVNKSVTKSTESPTLSPDVEIKEELLPVEVSKTPVTESINKTTTQESASPEPEILPTIKHEFTQEPKEAEETPQVETVSVLTQTDGRESTVLSNHSRVIGGRRRRPTEQVTTQGPEPDDAVAGANKEAEKDDKKVSYFAVIAAVLISAIVFFALGYLARRFKERRVTFKLPWKKNEAAISLETSPDNENVSAAKVYRDTDPDRATSVYDEIDPEKMKSVENNSVEVTPSNGLAEIHTKPENEGEGETDSATYAVPIKGDKQAAPNASTGENTPAQDSATKAEEIRYMDETDEEETAQAEPSAPLLPKTEADGLETEKDLATQVLNTVDKNLNAVSDTEPEETKQDENADVHGSPTETSRL